MYSNGPRTLYTVTKQWNQKEANWNNATKATAWSKKGGDFNATAVAKLTDTNYVQWENFDVTQAVKDFLKTPGSNYGFLLKFDSYTPSHLVLYASSEDVDSVKNRPKLTITVEEATGIIHAAVSQNNLIQVMRSNGSLKMHIPFKGNTAVSLLNMEGRQIASFTITANNQWITLPGNVSSGMHIVRIQNATKTLTTKVLITE